MATIARPAPAPSGIPLGVGALILRPPAALLVAGVTLAQAALTALRLPALPCPLHAATGIPCPGCGLSRAGAALLRGDVAEALRMHAFAPLFALCGVVVLVGLALPRPVRLKVGERLHEVESRRWVGLVLLLSLIVYWLVRLALGWRG